MKYVSSPARAALVFASLFISAPALAGDEIVLEDGTVLRGKIISETAESITFEGTINGIKATQVLRKAKIQIHANAFPDEAPAKPATPGDTAAKPATPATAKERAKAGDFAVLPVRGMFGKDYYPKGVADACKWCVENRVTDVVFVLESDGGYVWAAKETEKVLETFSGKLHFHVVVKKAITPASWLVFTCDTIGMTPAGSISGAVVTNKGQEVDAAITSADADKLASIAADHGHDRLLAQAIMTPDMTLWAVEDNSGKWYFAKELPEAEKYKDSASLAKGDRVIKLEADDAISYGVAAKMKGSTDDDIRALLKKPEFKSAGDKPKQLLEAGSRAANTGKGKIDAWLDRLNAAALACKDVKTEEQAINAIQRLKDVAAQEGSLKTVAKDDILGPYLDIIRERNLSKLRDKIREFEDLVSAEHSKRLH